MRYMLLMNYGGADCAPMSEWTPGEITAHIDFQQMLGADLVDRGELIDTQGLAAPERAKVVVADGVTAPSVTDGPVPPSRELLAGYWIVDVESPDRAIEIAALASAAPGPGGAPIRQAIEVREVMHAPAAADA